MWAVAWNRLLDPRFILAVLSDCPNGELCHMPKNQISFMGIGRTHAVGHSPLHAKIHYPMPRNRACRRSVSSQASEISAVHLLDRFPCASNVRVLAEALLSADRQEPLVRPLIGLSECPECLYGSDCRIPNGVGVPKLLRRCCARRGYSTSKYVEQPLPLRQSIWPWQFLGEDCGKSVEIEIC